MSHAARVPVEFDRYRYDVLIEPSALSRLGEVVREVAPSPAAALLADENVFEEHGMLAREAMVRADFHLIARALELSEDRKTLETLRPLYELLVDGGLERRSPVVALGGGVSGDLIGFLAATYLRGAPFVPCPTTLLAMVDASVGGKVGVNLPQGKNLVGAFHQPAVVVVDTDTLNTLPEREIRCGLAECVKHAVIRDPDLFAWIGQELASILELDPPKLVELVRRNVEIKARVVVADEKESGERAHLNFGHTFAHAIEATTGYGLYHHGEAVSLGMVAAANLAQRLGMISPELADRLRELLQRIGLPVTCPDLADDARLLEVMRRDKKVSKGRIRLILPTRLGEVTIREDVSDDRIAEAWSTLRE